MGFKIISSRNIEILSTIPFSAGGCFQSHKLYMDNEADRRRWVKSRLTDSRYSLFMYSHNNAPEAILAAENLSLTKQTLRVYFLAHQALVSQCLRFVRSGLEMIFRETRATKVVTEILEGDHFAQLILESIGFVQEGYFRSHLRKGGKYYDVVLLSYFKSDWEKSKEKPSQLLQQGTFDWHRQLPRSKERFEIFLLSDRFSWLNHYLVDFVDYLESMGHVIVWRHTVDALSPHFFKANKKSRKKRLCFCLGFTEILDQKTLAAFHNTVLVHESDLPRGKGWSPLTWQVLRGDSEIVVSLLEASEKVDSGQIYLQDKIVLEGTELIEGIRRKQAQATLSLCVRFIQGYPAVLKKSRVQEGLETFYSRRQPVHSCLKIDQSIEEQFNLFRVADNSRYPLFFSYRNRKYELRVYDRND